MGLKLVLEKDGLGFGCGARDENGHGNSRLTECRYRIGVPFLTVPFLAIFNFFSNFFFIIV